MKIQDHQTPLNPSEPGLQIKKHQALCACPLGKPKASPTSSDGSRTERLKLRAQCKAQGVGQSPSASATAATRTLGTPGDTAAAVAPHPCCFPPDPRTRWQSVSTPLRCRVYPERRDLPPCEGTEAAPTISRPHMRAYLPPQTQHLPTVEFPYPAVLHSHPVAPKSGSKLAACSCGTFRGAGWYVCTSIAILVQITVGWTYYNAQMTQVSLDP